MIPKIAKNILSVSRNLLSNVLIDKSYYEYINLFRLCKIKIGPFTDKQYLNCKISNFKNHIKFDSGSKYEKTNFKYVVKEETVQGKQVNYSIFVYDISNF